MVHQVHGGPAGEQVTAEGAPVTSFRPVDPEPATAPVAPDSGDVTLPRKTVEELMHRVTTLTAELDAALATVQVLTEENGRLRNLIRVCSMEDRDSGCSAMDKLKEEKS